MVPPLFTGMDIREMHFHCGQIDRRERIGDRVRIVRVCASVDDDSVSPAARFVKGVDDRTFIVGLERSNLCAAFTSRLLESRIDLCQANTPVDLGLACAEKIQVWAMNNQDAVHDDAESSGSAACNAL